MGCHVAMAAEKEWPVEIVFFPEPATSGGPREDV